MHSFKGSNTIRTRTEYDNGASGRENGKRTEAGERKTARSAWLLHVARCYMLRIRGCGGSNALVVVSEELGIQGKNRTRRKTVSCEDCRRENQLYPHRHDARHFGCFSSGSRECARQRRLSVSVRSHTYRSCTRPTRRFEHNNKNGKQSKHPRNCHSCRTQHHQHSHTRSATITNNWCRAGGETCRKLLRVGEDRLTHTRTHNTRARIYAEAHRQRFSHSR